MVTKVFKVYGRNGHRMRESFNRSQYYDWSDGDDIRRIAILNWDVTGTHDYTILVITRNTEAEVDAEFDGQYSDGIFENCATGGYEATTLNTEE